MSNYKRSPPFRAEHVGSLLRPDELVQKRYDVAEGRASQSDLEPLEDKSVANVVKLQQDCGFHALSSGEHARSADHTLPESWFAMLNFIRVDICSGEGSSKISMAWKNFS